VQVTSLVLVVVTVAVMANWLVTLAIVKRLNQSASSRPRAKVVMGLEAGLPVPPFTAQRLDGREVTLSDFSGTRAVLVFVNPGCTACEDGIPEYERISRVVRQHGGAFELVSGGGRDDTMKLLGEAVNNLDVMLAPQPANPLFVDFKVNATPLFTVFEQGKVVTSDMAWDTIPAWKELDKPSTWGSSTPTKASVRIT
jgi:thiol-disulfide isomerase/thioredoxin